MSDDRRTEGYGVRQLQCGCDWEASVPMGAIPVIAQGPEVIIAVAVGAFLVVVALFLLLREGDEQLEEEERPELEEGERPTDDLLEEREEVDEPVEDYEDMSLAEIKRAKMARVEGKDEGRETAGEATERAREEHVEEDEGERRKKEAGEESDGPGSEEADGDEDEREKAGGRDEDEVEEDDDRGELGGEQEPEDAEAEDEESDDEGGPGLPSPGEVSEASDVEEDRNESGREQDESSGSGLPTPSSFAEDDEDESAAEDEPDESAAEDEQQSGEKKGQEVKDGDGDVSEESEDPADEGAVDEDERGDEGGTEDQEDDEEGEGRGKQAEDDGDDGDGGGEGDGSDGAPEGSGGAETGPGDETSSEDDEDLPEDIDDEEAEPKSLEEGLEKTREGFIQQLSSLFSGDELSDEMVEEVEEVLFSADIGPRVAQDILDAIEEQLSREELDDPGKVWGFIRHYTEELLETHEEPLDATASDPPFVALVVGVNGVGKTTTIGKMASRFKRQGLSVLLVAGDTYRAAAVDQLGIWADRTGLPMHSGDEGADPASVIYSGIERAVEEDIDVVLCDTSGRLHTDVNLMEELEKMERVAGNAAEGAPEEVHLVLDANTGQNAIQQAEKFNESLDVSGITLTKFDGTARGGVILGVCKRFDSPIRYVGIGERVVDLREFDAGEFVDALFM